MISRETRLEIYRALQKQGSIWGKIVSMDHHTPDFTVLDFLSEIWDLRRLSSSDPRYKDAYGDARKHLIDNDDWEDDYTFLDRFKLLDCREEEFIKFLNLEMSPKVRKDKADIEKTVSVISGLLPKDYAIKRVSIKDGLPIHNVVSNSNEVEEYPMGTDKNTIPFFVNSMPDVYPSFIIETGTWDDYGYKTSCTLFSLDVNKNKQEIGYLKILHDEEYVTSLKLPKKFDTLSSHFCSLGQTEAYYYRLKELCTDNFTSVLYALKDAAFFPFIKERMENLGGFRHSLLRNDNAATILSAIQRKIERGDKADNWNFSFVPELPYGENTTPIDFNLEDLEDEDNHHRIHALIGPNGAGKTSILRSLVDQLIHPDGSFTPSKPIFAKIIVISFSIFDAFIQLRGKSVLNYVYCGLHNTESSIMTVEERTECLRIALEKINIDHRDLGYYKGFRRFIKALKIFYPDDWVDSMWDDEGLDVEKFLESSKVMSSGESMILNLVASLYANISENTLIVFDELEVHLHPAAIRKMMTLLFNITRQYNSSCILATHSSIVVQELLADNVTIVEKNDNNELTTRRLNHESLGESLSIISDDIFGEASISPYYVRFLNEVAGCSKSFDTMLKEISSDDLPPSLRLYMLARDIYEKNTAE